MNVSEWGKRISSRTDISMGLVHLTKGNGSMDPLDVLIKILSEQTIKGSTNRCVDGHQWGFICGHDPVVCFQDVPLYSVSENILWEQEFHKQNPTSMVRYTPFGLRFDKRYIFKNGGRPVIYENTRTAKAFLPEEQYWRIVKLDLGHDESLVDWTHEREWRIKGDFHFEIKDVEILLCDQFSLQRFNQLCAEMNMKNILSEAKGIILLKSLLY